MKLRRYGQFINESVEITDDLINILIERGEFCEELMELDYSKFDFTASYSDMCKKEGRNPKADFLKIQKYFDEKGFTLEKLKDIFSEENNKRCGYNLYDLYKGGSYPINREPLRGIVSTLRKQDNSDKIYKIQSEISKVKNQISKVKGEIGVKKEKINWLFYSGESDARLELTLLQLKSKDTNFRENKEKELETEVEELQLEITELENKLQQLNYELQIADCYEIVVSPFSVGSSLDSQNAAVDVYLYFLFEELRVFGHGPVWLGGDGWGNVDLEDDDGGGYSEAFIRYRYGYHQTEYGKLWMEQCGVDEEWFQERAMQDLQKYLTDEFSSIVRMVDISKDMSDLSLSNYSIIEEDRIIIDLSKLVEDINNCPINRYWSGGKDDYTVDEENIAARFTKELEGFHLDIELTDGDDLIIWGRFKED